MTCARISVLHYIMPAAPVLQDLEPVLLVPELLVPALLVPASLVPVWSDPVLPALFPQPVQI